MLSLSGNNRSQDGDFKVVRFQRTLPLTHSLIYLASALTRDPNKKTDERKCIERDTGRIIIPLPFKIPGGIVTLNCLIASQCDRPDSSAVHLINLTIFRNAPQKRAATAAAMKGDPLCN